MFFGKVATFEAGTAICEDESNVCNDCKTSCAGSSMCSKFCNEPRAVIFPICPRVDASMDCIAGLMAVPETEDRVNWVRSCWRDERLVDVAAAAVVGIEEDPVRNGDIKLGARLVEAFGV